MYEIYMINDQDTLTSIAERCGTTEEDIFQINGFDRNYSVVPGTQIVVPKSTKQPYRYYTVKKGDTLSQIAREEGIDYQLLILLNGLDENDYIYPNQTLILPKEGYQVYLTKENDTIDSVLRKLGISLDKLMNENENIYLRSNQVILFQK